MRPNPPELRQSADVGCPEAKICYLARLFGARRSPERASLTTCFTCYFLFFAKNGPEAGVSDWFRVENKVISETYLSLAIIEKQAEFSQKLDHNRRETGAVVPVFEEALIRCRST